MAVPKIAIIGAGLSGLTASIALHQQGFETTIYETREASLDIGGALMLSPNSLRVLDKLGIYSQIAELSYRFQDLHFLNADNTPIDRFQFGDKEKYGFDAVRIYRTPLINVLLNMVKENGSEIVYNKKFDRVVDETEASVTWQFTDGSRESASLLIGADGIHSAVRAYLHPNISRKFVNIIGVSAAISRAQIEDPDYPLPVTIVNPKVGAFLMAPQKPDGSELFIGKPRRLEHEPDRQGWTALMNDKEWCINFLQSDTEEFPQVVRRAVSKLSRDQIHLWPFYVIPTLDAWASKQGRVVIVGDAAHAMPPSSGQGVNQAFEDVFTLTKIYKQLGDTDRLNEGLARWQKGRQERIDRILKLNAAVENRRLPGSQQVDSSAFGVDWLYNVDFESQVQQWTDV